MKGQIKMFGNRLKLKKLIPWCISTQQRARCEFVRCISDMYQFDTLCPFQLSVIVYSYIVLLNHCPWL